MALAALLLKATLTSTLQVVVRQRTRSYVLPEDARLMRFASTAQEHPLVERCARAWRNDLESVPFFLAIALAYTLAGGGAASAWWLFGSYAALRYLHTLFYLRGMQPWRAIAFLVSLLICWILLVRTALVVVLSA